VIIVSHALEGDVDERLAGRRQKCGAKNTVSSEFAEFHREMIKFRVWYACMHAILIVVAAHGFHWI
jgi:hypothetical protein